MWLVMCALMYRLSLVDSIVCRDVSECVFRTVQVYSGVYRCVKIGLDRCLGAFRSVQICRGVYTEGVV